MSPQPIFEGTIHNMDIEKTLDNIRAYKNLAFEYQVATLFGLSKTSLSERKAKGSLFEKEIRAFCEKELLNELWLETGKGWTSSPTRSSQSLDWVMRIVADRDIKRMTVIKYIDHMGGEARGFIFEAADGCYSMEGSATKAGYIGAGPNFYRYILDEIRKTTVETRQVRITKNKTPEWGEIDICKYVLNQGSKKLNLDHEIIELRPDLNPKEYAKLKAEGIIPDNAQNKNYYEMDLIETEINKIIKNVSPERKRKILKMIKLIEEDNKER